MVFLQRALRTPELERAVPISALSLEPDCVELTAFHEFRIWRADYRRLGYLSLIAFKQVHFEGHRPETR